jgi:hypothetical protein
MNRREAIRMLATSVALPLMPGTLALLREARAAVATESKLRSLNAHQAATVTAMTEMILPRTDTPGATDAGAYEFIDLILTEWYDDAERARFLTGLADVDVQSQSLFGKEFIACTAIQQAEMLIVFGEQMTANVPTAHNPRPEQGDWASMSDESFYFMLRRLTLTAYCTSEAGATSALHFEIIPDHFDSCAAQPATGASKPR